MKKRLKILLLAYVCLAALVPSQTKAEDIPADITAVFALIEPYLVSGGIPSPGGVPSIPGATVNLGACQPIVGFVFPATIDIHFVPTITCPVNGHVYLVLVPSAVKVRLEILQGPVEKVEGDFAVQVKRVGSANYVYWQVLNGYVTVRPSPGMPAQSFNMTGTGQRMLSKQATSSKARLNLFDAITMDGMALLKEMSQKKPDPAVKKSEVCSLYDAVLDKPESGSLVNCRELK